jgi:hypothetical protein
VKESVTTIISDDKGDEYEVTIDLMEVNGRPEAKSMRVVAVSPGSFIIPKLFRQIPNNDVLLKEVRDKFRFDVSRYDLTPLTARRWNSSHEQLSLIATLYRDAHRAGRPVQDTLTEVLGKPKSTVTKWISLTRKAGYLGKAVGTKAGEA